MSSCNSDFVSCLAFFFCSHTVANVCKNAYILVGMVLVSLRERERERERDAFGQAPLVCKAYVILFRAFTEVDRFAVDHLWTIHSQAIFR